MSFADSAAAIRLLNENGLPRLRLPQHGATLAVTAHFTSRHEPALVALPTGVGKTAVMTLLPYFLSAKRVLVLVPSRLLREQIAEEFATLRLLRREGLVPDFVWSPKIKAIKSRPQSTSWDALKEFEVLISTPQSLVDRETIYLGPKGFFDLILIDEAQHTPASIWKSIIEGTADARQVYFTATPYRRDERRIQGTIVYEFSLREAILRKYVAPVDLRLIDEDGDSDDALVREVTALVRDPKSVYFGSPFIARTNTVLHAKLLLSKYEAAGLPVRLILGEDSLKKARQGVADVRDGEAIGLIMVGVLGEGFNFPAIKIAAYHRAHQSLPATLQFVGRISRVSEHGPLRALVLSTVKEGGEETEALYRKDAQWATLIPDLADELFQREARRALIDRELLTPIQGMVSPSNLRPPRVVDIFDVGCDLEIRSMEELDDETSVVQWWQTEARDLLLIIRKKDSVPRWLYESVLIGTAFELYYAIYSRPEGLLFLSAGDYSDSFAQLLGVENPRRISPERLYAVLNAQGVEAYFNVGMRSVEVPNSRRAAYIMNSGPSVGDTIRPEDSATYTLGHAVAKIREDGKTRSFGIAIRKSRVWMPQSGPIIELRDWCNSLARLLHRSAPALMANGLSLRPETPFSLFPEHAIAAVPPARLMVSNAMVRWGDNYESSLVDLHAEAVVDVDRKFCELRLSADAAHGVSVTYDVDGNAMFKDDGTEFIVADEAVDASAALTTDPYSIYFGDGSSSRGFLLSSPSDGIPSFPVSSIETPKWIDVDISVERSTSVVGKKGIFQFLHETLALRHSDSLIINDDGAYEIADIIVITNRGAHVDVMLIHCKGAPERSERVQQLYDVVGQALRSMRWVLNRAGFWSDVLRRRRERPAFNIVRDPNDVCDEWIERFAERSPVTNFHIVVAQPGLSQRALRAGTAANVLLTSCRSSAVAVGSQFSIFCSED